MEKFPIETSRETQSPYSSMASFCIRGVRSAAAFLARSGIFKIEIASGMWDILILPTAYPRLGVADQDAPMFPVLINRDETSGDCLPNFSSWDHAGVRKRIRRHANKNVNVLCWSRHDEP
jgi:hypothetical protein